MISNEATYELLKMAVEWAIEKLADYPNTKTAQDILRKELMTFHLQIEHAKNA